MNLNTIKAVDGQEFVLLPLSCYQRLKNQIDSYIEKEKQEYVPFVLEDYIDNPIALVRIQAGMTQQQLAVLLNVSQAYVSKLESSQRVSSKMMLKVNQVIKENT
ncbi:MAG: hypothetical protein RLZ35_486 [Pseudomonadota bacterium]|jgi:DNA-binding transcriptional regulator YiaG